MHLAFVLKLHRSRGSPPKNNIPSRDEGIYIRKIQRYDIVRQNATDHTDVMMVNNETAADAFEQDLIHFQNDEILKQALAQGVNLREYARDIDRELHQVESESIAEYVDESDSVVNLYHQIHSCDSILARMQEMLLGFQADLGGISDEIRHLQRESCHMNVQIKNRRQVETHLATYLDQVTITPGLTTTLEAKGVNDPEFIQAVETLRQKLTYATTTGVQASALDVVPSHTKSVVEVHPQLLRLKTKVVMKTRSFLLEKLAELRQPRTNVQMVQHHSLLPLRYIMAFYRDVAPEVAMELRGVYVDTMATLMHETFRLYMTQLSKFHQVQSTKLDVIAIEEVSKVSKFGKASDPFGGLFFSSITSSSTKGGSLKKQQRCNNASFNLQHRDKILLDELTTPPILAHVAESTPGFTLAYEKIFRSIQQHLMNAATSEYYFIVDFFRCSLRPTEVFLQIFARTISLCLETWENYLFSCYDALGLLLMIRITTAQRLMMKKRRIMCLDVYFDRVILLLWPRFQYVVNANIQSIRNARPKHLGFLRASPPNTNAEPKTHKAAFVYPHYVTRRYAEFVSSILGIVSCRMTMMKSHHHHHHHDHQKLNTRSSAGALMLHTEIEGVDDALQQNLILLQDEMIVLLQRLANEQSDHKAQLMFLINNYDQILEIFAERQHMDSSSSTSRSGMDTTQGNHRPDDSSHSRLDTSSTKHSIKFEQLLTEQRDLYVEEELREHYGGLITFVKQTEAQISQAEGAAVNIDRNKVQANLVEFHGQWKFGIEQMNASIMTHFSNFRNGMIILKQVLTQLLLYYTRFGEIVQQCTTLPQDVPELVKVNEILYEIKKYSRSF